MLDSKTIEIVTEICYKVQAEKGEVNFTRVEAETNMLLDIIERISGKREVPFNSSPSVPRGGKQVGDLCKDCGSPLVMGKKRGLL